PDGSPRFAERKILPLEVEYPDAERRAHTTLARYRAERLNHLEGDRAAERATDFVTLLLKKRFFSSPLAFSNTLEAHLRTLEGAQRRRDAERALERAISRVDDDTADEAEHAEAEEDALAVAAGATGPLTPGDQKLLDELRSWADANRNRADRKAERLLRYL